MTFTAPREAGVWLERYGGRPFLVAVAALNAITGIAAAIVLAPLSFGADALAFRRGAEAIAEGTYDKDFLYSPLAGLLATPLTWVSPVAASIVMSAIGLALLVAGVAVESRGMALADRLLVLVAALTFIPVVNELLLGQTTLVFAALLWPIARRPDRMANGIALGVALALAPKPLLLPVLVWMLVRRPKALAGLTAGAVGLVLVSLVVMGPELHRLWADTLAATGAVSRNGNQSLWAGGVTPIAIALAAVVSGATLVALWRNEGAGLLATLLAGLLLAPYTLIYSASIVLIAVAPALRVSPLAARLLAIVANPAVLAAFGAWCAAGIASAVAASRASRSGP